MFYRGIYAGHVIYIEKDSTDRGCLVWDNGVPGMPWYWYPEHPRITLVCPD